MEGGKRGRRQEGRKGRRKKRRKGRRKKRRKGRRKEGRKTALSLPPKHWLERDIKKIDEITS